MTIIALHFLASNILYAIRDTNARPTHWVDVTLTNLKQT